MIAIASIRPIKLKMRDFLWRNSCNLSLLKPNSQDSSIFCRFSLLFQLKFLAYSLIKRYSTLELIYRLRKINNFILLVLRFQKLINSLSIEQRNISNRILINYTYFLSTKCLLIWYISCFQRSNVIKIFFLHIFLLD